MHSKSSATYKKARANLRPGNEPVKTEQDIAFMAHRVEQMQAQAGNRETLAFYEGMLENLRAMMRWSMGEGPYPEELSRVQELEQKPANRRKPDDRLGDQQE